MDNQHNKIIGDRDLTENEISVLNGIQSEGVKLEELVNNAVDEIPHADRRWIAIGRTHLQEGLMALTRAIARPNSF